jgi:hypothetical protein
VRYCERRGVTPSQQFVGGKLPRLGASDHNKDWHGGHRRRSGKAGQQNRQHAEQPHTIPSSVLVRFAYIGVIGALWDCPDIGGSCRFGKGWVGIAQPVETTASVEICSCAG